ncbi:MAG: penicillin-binding protein 2 [Verrucomicrobia bacterium]|nr:penicillin-binding protein 2 [Verrucomicrobiota bacterium]
MTNVIHRGRLWCLAGAVGLGFVGLGARFVELQVVRCDEFRERARRQNKVSVLTQPPRGDIRDIRGNLLATSIPVKTVCVDPALLTNHQSEVARVLAPSLLVPEAELLKNFRNLTHLVTNESGIRLVTNHCLVLQHNVPVETWTNLEQTLLWNYFLQCTNALLQKQVALNAKQAERTWKSFLPGRSRTRQARLTDRDKNPLRNSWLNAVFATDDQLRTYPNKQLAAHVLGFTGTAEQEVNGRIIPQTVGVEGIEATFNDKLTGVCGWRVGYTDGRRRELVVYREQNVDPAPGLNVVLTLDSRVQYIVEEELAQLVSRHSPKGAMAIVMRPATGEILALANWPTFDPGNLRASNGELRRNRAIGQVAEPGSTFKIVTVSSALNDQIVTLADRFDCEHGHFFFAGRPLRDHLSYGVLTVEEIITKSSNIGTAKIAIKMGEQRLYQYIRACGFGNRTGIPLGGESGGIVHPLDKWSKLSISRVPIGQGVAATPLQMTLAMCMIANGGVLMRPLLVDHTEDESGHVVTQYKPIVVHRVISERAAKDTTKALKGVVSKTGTAATAALDNYTVAGKTGTAEKPGPGGYLDGKYFSSFIGFFPADDPELCISVFLDEPERKTGYYGGQIVAPAFKHMAERIAHYLNIRPDLPPPSAATNQASVAVLSQSNHASHTVSAGR